jgi:hypothetical protein
LKSPDSLVGAPERSFDVARAAVHHGQVVVHLSLLFCILRRRESRAHGGDAAVMVLMEAKHCQKLHAEGFV